MLKRWHVVVTDTYITADSVIVEAEDEDEAREKADDLIEEGWPQEDYRDFHVTLVEERELDDDFD